MLERTKRLYEEMDKMMEVCVSKTFTTNMFADMDEEEIKLMQSCFKMYESAKELSLKQAEIIENQDKKLNDINRKLDKLLSRREV